MTLQEWQDKEDHELDERLTSLFRSVQPPAPPAGFVSRTMNAVRLAPLPRGRQALRRSWIVPAGWAALVTAAACVGIANQQVVAEMISSLVTFGIRGGMRLVQTVHTSSMVFDLFVTVGRAAARALGTREAAAGLTSMALVAAVSLSMLNRLLFSKKESSIW